MPGYQQALRLWWRDLKRDLTPNRIRRFGQALVLAAEMPERYTALHAHFIHTPGSVTRYAAHLRGLGFHATVLQEGYAGWTAAGLPLELVAEEVRLAARALARLVGRIDVEDLLDVVFRDFCIGK